jgi:hypothetical protein
MCADGRNARYPSKIRLGNRKLTVKMALGDHRGFTRFVIGASLVASLGTNTSPLHESKYAVSATDFARNFHILGDFTVTINTTTY